MHSRAPEERRRHREEPHDVLQAVARDVVLLDGVAAAPRGEHAQHGAEQRRGDERHEVDAEHDVRDLERRHLLLF